MTDSSPVSSIGHSQIRGQLVAFAWVVEIVGVGCGVVNSVFTTFGADLPSSLLGWIPAVPLAALATTELLRVPFAQTIATKRSMVGRVLAILGLVALSGLAVENWIFGFERIVSKRLELVTEAQNTQAAARAKYEAVLGQAEGSAAASKASRQELDGRLQGRREQINSAQKSREAEDAAHQRNLEAIRDTCKLTAKNDNCARDRSRDEDKRYAGEVARISGELDAARAELSVTQSDLDRLTRTDKAAEDKGAASLSELKSRLDATTERLRTAADANQIYRLASIWFRVAPEELSQEQISQARGFFTGFGALIIAFAGSLAAFLGTHVDTAPTAAQGFGARIYRALRVLVRRRKVRTQIAEKIVEAVKYVDRVVYKHVPVDPQTGNVSFPADDRDTRDGYSHDRSMREISLRAKGALKLIGAESPINARRVRRFGVLVEAATEEKGQARSG
jgi:hypothetical protein